MQDSSNFQNLVSVFVELLRFGDGRSAMAGDTLHLHHVRFSELAAQSFVDVPSHSHHDASGLLCWLVIRSSVNRNLSIGVGRRTNHFRMAVVAHNPESHCELLHHLNNLWTRHILWQHLEVRRRRRSRALSTTTTALTALTALAALSRRLSCNHHRQ